MLREFMLFPPHSAMLAQQAVTYCLGIGLHWLQSGTDMKWKSVAVQSFGGAGTGQHHPATVEMQQYFCCLLYLIKCQICDGTCNSFLDGPTKRKGCIWYIVNNIRWEIRRQEIKIFLYSLGLQTCWSTSSVIFCWEKSNVKSMQEARAPGTIVWLV